MRRVPWQRARDWASVGWTKFILRKEKSRFEAWVEISEWLLEQPSSGCYMSHVVEYDQYIVVRIENPEDAFAFKMRWL